MRVCLFCANPAGNKEHAWPRWLISSVGTDRRSPTEYWNTLTAPPKRWHGPEFTTRQVCERCNNGWMSELESAVRATMGSLVNDLSIRLDEEQQRLLAQWTTKTAMVIEGAKQAKNNFYSAEQRSDFRTTTLVPPAETAIWLGRCVQSNLLHGEARKLHVANATATNPLRGWVCNYLCHRTTCDSSPFGETQTGSLARQSQASEFGRDRGRGN